MACRGHPGRRWAGRRYRRRRWLLLEALEEERDGPGAVLIAQQADLSEQPRPIAAALRPALDQVGLVRRQHTAPGAMGPLPLRRTLEGEIAIHRASSCADDLGDIQDREPG